MATNASSNNNNNNQRRNPKKNNNNNNNFVGGRWCKELNGYIYDFNPDNYVTTTEAIANYFGRTCEYGYDIVYVINHFKLPEIKNPMEEDEDDDIDDNVDDHADGDDKDNHILDNFTEMTKEILFQEKLETYHKRKNRLDSNLRRLYVFMWDQCTKKLQNKLQTHKEYLEVSNKSDGLGLLFMIRNEIYGYETHLYKPLALFLLLQKYYSYHQGTNETVPMYHAHFRNYIKVIEYVNGGTFGYENGILEMLAVEKNWDLENITDEMKKEAEEVFLATAFLSNSDPIRYGNLLIELHNSYICGRNEYPKTVQDAYRLLTHWKNRYSEY